MNVIKKLRSKSKMVIIAGLLLFGLALTPATSFAGNDHDEGRRNNEAHEGYKNQRNHHAENNRHRHNSVRHHMKHKYADHRKQRNSHHGKHRTRHYSEPHYVVINNRPARLGLRIGLHSGNFDVVFRD